MWKSATLRARDFKGEANLDRKDLPPAANFEDVVAGRTSEYIECCCCCAKLNDASCEVAKSQEMVAPARGDGAEDKLSGSLSDATRALVFEMG